MAAAGESTAPTQRPRRNKTAGKRPRSPSPEGDDSKSDAFALTRFRLGSADLYFFTCTHNQNKNGSQLAGRLHVTHDDHFVVRCTPNAHARGRKNEAVTEYLSAKGQ